MIRSRQRCRKQSNGTIVAPDTRIPIHGAASNSAQNDGTGTTRGRTVECLRKPFEAHRC